jgi:hypothetical protein
MDISASLAWLINHQQITFFSHNKSAPHLSIVFFFYNKSARTNWTRRITKKFNLIPQSFYYYRQQFHRQDNAKSQQQSHGGTTPGTRQHKWPSSSTCSTSATTPPFPEHAPTRHSWLETVVSISCHMHGNRLGGRSWSGSQARCRPESRVGVNRGAKMIDMLMGPTPIEVTFAGPHTDWGLWLVGGRSSKH